MDGIVGLWDSEDGAEVRSFRGHTGTLRSVAFSPNGERLVSAGYDLQVKVWDVMTQQENRRYPVTFAHPYGLAFSPDGSLLAAVDGSIFMNPHKDITILDTRTGLKMHTLKGHTGRVISVAFSPQGRPGHSLVASASTDRTVKIWDATTGQLLRTFSGHEGDVTGVAFSLDGRHVASSSADHTVRVWDADTGKEFRLLRHTDLVTSVAFSPDGRLATSSADRTVRLWDAADDTRCMMLEGHTDSVSSVAFSPDGSHLAAACADHTLRVWDAASGKEIFVLRGHTGPVLGLAYSPQGDRVVSVSQDDGTVRVWDIRTGRQLLSLRQPQVRCVAFSPNGDCVATGDDSEAIQFWDAATPKPDDPGRSAAWFKHYAEQKQWDKAAAALARTDQQLPGDVHLWRSAGYVYYDSGDWDQAADCYARAIKREPAENAWELRNNIGLCRKRQGRWEEAITHFDKAIQQEPNDKRLRRNRADCFLGLRQWERAIADFSASLPEWPDDVEVRVARGRCYVELGKWSEAAADFDKVADLDRKKRESDFRKSILAKPDNAIHHNNFANWLLKQDRLAEAEVEVREAIKINPMSGNAHFTLGTILCAAGKRTEAETEFAEAIRLTPSPAAFQSDLGHAYARAGDWAKAATVFAGVVESNPSNYWARLYKAAYALAGNDVEAYRRTCAESLKLFGGGNNPDALNVTIRTCVLAANAVPDSAIPVELMKKVVKEHPRAWMLYALGMAHYRSGQFSEALARFEEAIKVDPAWTHGTCVTGLALALAHHRMGHKDKAREWLNRTVAQLERGTPEMWPAAHFPTHPADWVTCVILRKEAEALIGEEPAKIDGKK
jgi:WD40 repeat protein/tetratricopeptide (TPR) repeat protein